MESHPRCFHGTFVDSHGSSMALHLISMDSHGAFVYDGVCAFMALHGLPFPRTPIHGASMVVYALLWCFHEFPNFMALSWIPIFHGAFMDPHISWCFHGSPYFMVLSWTCMMLGWCLHGAFVDSHGASMVLPWCVRSWTCMVLPLAWCVHAVSMMRSWTFMVFPRCFQGASMALSLRFNGASMGLS